MAHFYPSSILCSILKGDNVTLCMESFTLDQLDEALDLIKNEVTLIPGGSYQAVGVHTVTNKELIEEKLNIKYVILG